MSFRFFKIGGWKMKTPATALSGFFGPRLIKVVACVVLVSLLPLATGCYGSFPLVHIIYKFNGEITDYKVVHSIVLWVFLIIPVYWVAFLGDFIVLNLIEFWTGEKIMVSSQTLQDGTRVTLEPSADGTEAVLTASREGRVLQQMRFVRRSDTQLDVLDDSGRKVGMILRTPASGLVLADAQGLPVKTLGNGEISQFRKAMESLEAVPAPVAADR